VRPDTQNKVGAGLGPRPEDEFQSRKRNEADGAAVIRATSAPGHKQCDVFVQRASEFY